MATKAKLEGNARYLSKFKTVSIRFPLEDYEKIKSAADQQGVSVSAYTVQATTEKMQKK